MGVLYLLSAGSSAKKSRPRIVVEKDSEIVGRLLLRTIDAVVVGQNSQITTQAIFELSQLPANKFASLGSETPNCLDTADLLQTFQSE